MTQSQSGLQVARPRARTDPRRCNRGLSVVYLEQAFLGYFQVGSYRYRSLIEGLCTYRSLIEALKTLNSPSVVSFNSHT